MQKCAEWIVTNVRKIGLIKIFNFTTAVAFRPKVIKLSPGAVDEFRHENSMAFQIMQQMLDLILFLPQNWRHHYE